MMKPFKPTGDTVNIVVGAASARAALGPESSNGVLQCRVMNNGTATVWINFGNGTVAATLATGIPIGAGRDEVFTVPAVATTVNVAAIAAAASGTIYFTPGEGM